ncbi:ATP-dependent helicase HrpB [Streptomyces sp. CHA1]|uniref:ATP-dependent helicase HrpB n=1 Tax=unclassified Streptomyces TaxID=2593676 RepID=UPI001BFC2A6E|nr:MULTISPECIES: ATP-dependent helicase HrpB [unclassified Streptomyces]MBT3155861.1 ATP-dependent helicase HrpB [Streptomyces sp. G11C]MCO6703611.1 ATP-dependent helicase HrpB [Streptomyces sp. CHB9.2]MCO6709823.1 ATP-dependent helicase HrpB [Streptomyces sp. CHA3]MCO6715567.1 ATP-dependent helicase HrpB [Streptomyces sp. CHB19.2]MCO6727362.1 ATP-dependent helicase HrpB [Streptomyces sp. CHA16]
MIRTDALAQLPVRSVLPALREALDGPGTAVLCAPPGTGKTTLVPLALAGLLGDGPPRRVLVAEPRRIAARAAARRMAWLLGEEPGRSVGHTVRGERVVSPGTRVEVVTTGVLVRRVQRDQELPGVDVVIIDECHERHLDADTAAAFLLDVRAALRPELRLVAASATTDAEGWARLLGGAPVVTAEGVSHPVETVWAPPPGTVRPPHGMRVDPALLSHVAATVRRALAEREGDVLCFLPGVGEIGRVAGELGAPTGVEVLQVHGRAPAAVQDAVLAGSPGRRVVLATSVAESSLTVPGVRVVVDSGLAREPRTDHARGLSALTTVRASQASGRQRAGRAGREAPGTVYRCWTEAEDARLPRFPPPEIKVADLTDFALQTASWGDPDASGLALLDPPPAGAMAAAREVLTALGAVTDQGAITARGERFAGVGVHPRLARALLDGAPEVGGARAAELVALLSEEPPRAYGDDLAAAWRTARRGQDAYAARWRREAKRLASSVRQAPREGAAGDDAAAGLVAALAFPERLARARSGDGYLMVSGTGAELGPGSALRESRWLAVAVADRPVDRARARVRLAAPVDEATARWAAAPLHRDGEEIGWIGGDVVARRVERLGAVELAVRPLTGTGGAGQVRAALLAGLEREGLGLLRWSRAAAELRQRLAFLHRAVGGAWPDVSEEALLARAEEWLEPELGRARRRADLARVDAGACLRRLLPWAGGEAGRLDELAPERLEVPSGSRVRLDYTDPERPVLAVKLQELFGLTGTPLVAGVPVLVHLLSPAGRPAAVTADLASFWADGYRAVRAELRGRYPKHPWPENPATATPTRHTKARAEREGRGGD